AENSASGSAFVFCYGDLSAVELANLHNRDEFCTGHPGGRWSGTKRRSGSDCAAIRSANRTLVTGATIQCLSHSANPAIEIWSCWLDSHQHRPAYEADAFVCRPQQQTLELARSLELRSGLTHAPAL